MENKNSFSNLKQELTGNDYDPLKLNKKNRKEKNGCNVVTLTDYISFHGHFKMLLLQNVENALF